MHRELFQWHFSCGHNLVQNAYRPQHGYITVHHPLMVMHLSCHVALLFYFYYILRLLRLRPVLGDALKHVQLNLVVQ